MHRKVYGAQLVLNDGKTIANLPVEVLQMIFDYLDPVCLSRTVTLVCKRFASILLNDDYWKLIYTRSLKKRHFFDDFPILTCYGLYEDKWRCHPDVHWRDMSVGFEKVKLKWTAPIASNVHASTETIDTVHIIKDTDVCITGSRERCIDLWNLSTLPRIKCSVVEAHRGWVSCLDSYEKDYFISGGWDSNITYWNIGQSSCQPVWTFKCDRGVMSVAGRRGLVAAGSFSPSITLIDPRIQLNQKSTQFAVHTKPLVNLILLENLVVSIGRDQKLTAFDLRKLDVVSKTQICKTGTPRSLAAHEGIIYVGDTKGMVHLIDARNNFSKIQKLAITPSGYQVASVCPSLGHFIAGCTDHTVKLVVPTDPICFLNIVDVEHEVTTMSSQNGKLVVGKTNGAVSIFNV